MVMLSNPESSLERRNDTVLVNLRPFDHPLIDDIYEMRQKYAMAKGWEKAEDPDCYDEMDTVTLAVSHETDGFRASLRLTLLGDNIETVIRDCLSLKMLGEGTELRKSAEEQLLSGDVVRPGDVVYDMTRFVIDSDKYKGSLGDNIRDMRTEFLMMIGGAVAVTNQDAFVADSAVWLFTAETSMKRLLEEHDIRPTVLADAENDEGVRLQFCAIRPFASFSEVKEGMTDKARSAATLITIGRRAISV
jgi:hypothetical protein